MFDIVNAAEAKLPGGEEEGSFKARRTRADAGGGGVLKGGRRRWRGGGDRACCVCNERGILNY